MAATILCGHDTASMHSPYGWQPYKKAAGKPSLPCSHSVFQIRSSGSGLSSNLDDLSLVVASASLADLMRLHQSAALAALYKSRSRHLPLRMLHISSRLGMFILRADRHGLHLLINTSENIQDSCHSWIKLSAIAAALTLIQVVAANRAQAPAVLDRKSVV